jgi:hypothetical protein
LKVEGLSTGDVKVGHGVTVVAPVGKMAVRQEERFV